MEALSAILNEATRLPAAVGVKVTLSVQLPLAAMLPPQLLAGLVENEKSPELLPVMDMLLMVKAAVPVLVRVTVRGELGDPTVVLLKVKLVVLRLALEPMPVPVRVSDWGLPGALSVRVTAADSAPAIEGV